MIKIEDKEVIEHAEAAAEHLAESAKYLRNHNLTCILKLTANGEVFTLSLASITGCQVQELSTNITLIKDGKQI